MISTEGMRAAHAAMAAIRKRLMSKNPKAVLLALTVRLYFLTLLYSLSWCLFC